MTPWKEISPYDITKNPFEMIHKQWMLITAEKEGKINTMTASWGGVGVLWNKPVAFLFIRPQRYTREFVDGSTRCSLTFFPEEFRKQLSYLGTVSGRDEDKIAKSGLTVEHVDEVPTFTQAETTLVCKKLYCQKMDPESFLYAEIAEKNYPEKDFHYVYVAEIEKVLVKE